MGLRLGKAKRWDALTLDDFSRLADGMGVTSAAILEPVTETIEIFRSKWEVLAKDLPVSQQVSEAVEEQLATVPAVSQSGPTLVSPAP